MLNFLFGFHGRIRRTHYLLASLGIGFVLACVGVSAVVSGLSISDFGTDNADVRFDPSPLGFGIASLVGIVGFWSMLAITVKRWHDIGVSGWFSLLSLPGVTHFAVFLLLCLLPGTVGGNIYGDDPRGRSTITPSIPAPAAA
ncbi:MAG TPA: DUF805 domain-containing protein [Caulobacteraceae bacterium]|jgi:uncharacterized membrane protein YhaH (DUF805 family)|nr:DUF805 domain-containing protein [Caulobacteraceae bacterium]